MSDLKHRKKKHHLADKWQLNDAMSFFYTCGWGKDLCGGALLDAAATDDSGESN